MAYDLDRTELNHLLTPNIDAGARAAVIDYLLQNGAFQDDDDDRGRHHGRDDDDHGWHHGRDRDRDDHDHGRHHGNDRYDDHDRWGHHHEHHDPVVNVQESYD